MKTIKCIKCNAVIENRETATPIPHTTGTRYYCADCRERVFNARHYGYGNENNRRTSKPTAQGFTISKEFEIPGRITTVLSQKELETALCTLDNRGWMPTSDSTVYVECKSLIYNGLNGYNKDSKTIANVTHIERWCNDGSYGTHTNIGHIDFDSTKMDILRQWRETLLTPLQDYLCANPIHCEDIFSRRVEGWCGRMSGDYTQHAVFINFQHSTWVEFRINKYTSYEQDSYATKVCIALFEEMLKFAKAVIANRTTYNGRKLAEVNRKVAEKTAENLKATFIKMHTAKMMNSTATVTA